MQRQIDTLPATTMTGKIPGSVFIFLSGLGSGIADLMPLAVAIHNEGHTCELLSLAINVTDDSKWPTIDQVAIDQAAITAQIAASVAPHIASGNKVYLVGFSLGATFAVLYAADHACHGILAISTFLKPHYTKLSQFLFWYRRWIGRPYLDRVPQVTVRETAEQLDLSSRLPFNIVDAAIKIGSVGSIRLEDVMCPILFVHSFDDRVADYPAVVAGLRRCGLTQARMISFNHLNHYLHFDMSPAKLVRFALHYFGLPPGPSIPRINLSNVDQTKTAADLLKLFSEERRHWTLLMFNTIAGFFTIFSGLLYFTLKDVIEVNSKAPYYLISYAISTNIYLSIVILYFFYANRVDAYIKFFLEPLVHGVTWAAFRTSKWMAGRESFWTTSMATIPLAVVPIIVSLVSLGVCAIWSWDRLIQLDWDYLVLKMLFISATILSFYTMYALISHNRFTKRWLFSAHPADKSDFETETLLFALYQSVSPGCVCRLRF